VYSRLSALQQQNSGLLEDVKSAKATSTPVPPRKSVSPVSEEMSKLKTELAAKKSEIIQLQAQLIESKQTWADYVNTLQVTLQEVENEAVRVKMANAEMRTKIEEFEAHQESEKRPKKSHGFFNRS
jgi:phage shock protein A